MNDKKIRFRGLVATQRDVRALYFGWIGSDPTALQEAIELNAIPLCRAIVTFMELVNKLEIRIWRGSL
jgi:hypothetical protein